MYIPVETSLHYNAQCTARTGSYCRIRQCPASTGSHWGNASALQAQDLTEADASALQAQDLTKADASALQAQDLTEADVYPQYWHVITNWPSERIPQLIACDKKPWSESIITRGGIYGAAVKALKLCLVWAYGKI